MPPWTWLLVAAVVIAAIVWLDRSDRRPAEKPELTPQQAAAVRRYLGRLKASNPDRRMSNRIVEVERNPQLDDRLTGQWISDDHIVKQISDSGDYLSWCCTVCGGINTQSNKGLGRAMLATWASRHQHIAERTQ